MGDPVYASAIHGISRGLPQGGVLSPLLWLIYCDQILPRLKAKRRAWGEDPETSRDLAYADDITDILTAKTEEEIKEKAHRAVEWIGEIL